MELSNRIRYYCFTAAVLDGQARDPLCGVCKAYANTVKAIREQIAEFELSRETEELTGELKTLLSAAKETLARLTPPENAMGQKKAGRCKMPEGVCFVKSSKAVIEKIS